MFERLLLLASLVGTALSFVPTTQYHQSVRHNRAGPIQTYPSSPAAQQFTLTLRSSRDAENPIKHPDFLKGPDGDPVKVDPALLLSLRLNGCNLFFVGMMGCGKSAVGKTLARRMGSYTFLDTDEVLEEAVGKTIPQIFKESGELRFRDIETQTLDRVHNHPRCLVSTGGGLAVRDENWAMLQTGIVVYLNVAPEVIIERIKGTDRPLLQTPDPLKTLKELYDKRGPRYEEADVIVTVRADMDLEATADACVEALHDFIDHNPPAWKKSKPKAQTDAQIDLVIAKLVGAK